MSYYYGTFACGCEGRTNVTGPVKNRQWIADKRFEKLCPDCYHKELLENRDIANKKAAEEAKEMELPNLTGTEKQIAWANTLRNNIIKKINELDEEEKREIMTEDEEIQEALEYLIKNYTNASWYIDNRYFTIYDFEKIVEKSLRVKKEEEYRIINADTLAEATVYPEDAKTSSIAEIKMLDEKITVLFEKNESFIETVKDLGYEWTGVWEKKLNQTTGTKEDRAAELGNKLLNKGFPIRIMDEDIRQRAIDGKFEPECKRWIFARTKGNYKGWFSIEWEGYDDSLYGKARKLPSSKWDRPNVVVKPEYFEEIQEFAELFGFKLSKGATKLIEEARIAKEKAAIVIPAIAEKEDEKDGLKEILESSDDIIDDLKD